MFIERLHCSYSVREDQALYTVACELALARTVRLRTSAKGALCYRQRPPQTKVVATRLTDWL